MRGDFTRPTFDPKRHFSKVLMQQGRVQMDADWNEQQDLTLHRVETETGDVIGVSGGPRNGAGFEIFTRPLPTGPPLPIGPPVTSVLPQEEITATERVFPAGRNELVISAGRYYVDGILCENEEAVPYALQPGLPDPPAINEAGEYLAYLDVWPRHRTALEDPQIREVALGGPDTATREQIVWQVRLFRVGEIGAAVACSNASRFANVRLAAPGRLAARASATAASNDPCIVAPGAGYRRLENQLYRVEVHDGDLLGAATFKWSRDNGSIATRWESQNGNDLTVSSIGRDKVLSFASGQLVELTDDTRELLGQPGTLVRLTRVEGQVLTIDPTTATGPVEWTNFPINPRVRRWDGLLTPTNSNWLQLEDGVEVQFTPAAFKTGDYWMIAARTATADVEWPKDPATNLPAAKLADGITHHECNLALLSFNNGVWTSLSDCRKIFPPLTELTSFFYVGGDGQEAMHDFTPDFTPDIPFSTPETIGAGGEITERRRAGSFTPLPQKIEVAAANGQWPVPGAIVRFSVVDQPGGGRLKGGAPEVTGREVRVATDGSGIAACEWQLGSSPHSQRVEAVLLKDDGNPLEIHPLHFNANLSVADHVAYDPGQCSSLQGQTTVQAAIDRLSDLVSLYEVSGDGQSVLPNEQLEPLVVVASSLCGPVDGMNVEFTVRSGDGVVSAPSSGGARVVGGNATGVVSQVTVPTATVGGQKGLASCNWTLGPSLRKQVVEAVLQPGTEHLVAPTIVRFTAQRLQGAIRVTSVLVHTLASSFGTTGAGTVVGTVGTTPTGTGGTISEQASEELARDSAGALEERQAVDPLPTWVPLANDSQIALDQLLSGVRVVCSESIDGSAIIARNGQNQRPEPTCFVTLEAPVTGFTFPYPPAPLGTVFSTSPGTTLAADSDVNNARLIAPAAIAGYTPLTLAATVQISDKTITWQPLPGVKAAMDALFQVFGRLNVAGPVLARFTLKGSFISSTEKGPFGRPALHLDGAAFGQPSVDQKRTDIFLPSGDHTPGRNFEMWFWVKAPPRPVLFIDKPTISLIDVPLGTIAEDVFTLRNIGDAPFRLLSIEEAGNFFTYRVNPLQSFSPDSLGVLTRAAVPPSAPGLPPPPVQSLPVRLDPDQGVTVTVSFSCAGENETLGAVSDLLTIKTDSNVPLSQVNLVGSCLPAEGPPRSFCKINKTEIIFAAPPGGSAEDSASITNDGFVPAARGDDPFTLSKVNVVFPVVSTGPPTLSGIPSGVSARDAVVAVTPPFSIVDPPNVPVVLADGKSQVVRLKYSRGLNVTGEEHGELSFTINKIPGCPSVRLIGRASAATQVPVLDVAGGGVDFGVQNLGSEAERDFVVRNAGTTKLEVKASAGHPYIRVSPEPLAIEPGGFQAINVRFVGDAIPATERGGAKATDITLRSNDPINPIVEVRVKWNLTSERVKNPKGLKPSAARDKPKR